MGTQAAVGTSPAAVASISAAAVLAAIAILAAICQGILRGKGRETTHPIIARPRRRSGLVAIPQEDLTEMDESESHLSCASNVRHCALAHERCR